MAAKNAWYWTVISKKITDSVAKARFGIMSTPGPVMNGQVATSGHVLNASEIGQLLAQGS
ncbi:thioredoxin family protein [uncultured Sulfitobacter sp.]|uniref:thioredoxin family protein n=1 Tax=uncultured Sulfitobacter sp. TaxID=191468 RepID=UPI00343D70EC